MPRYRISFAREWAVGRWGFLDRFFHDLGGRESDPSGPASAWVVNFRGPARQLGRELAMALNIGEAEYRQFGPIFDIEELPGPRSAPAEGRPAEPPGAEDAPRDREPASRAAAEPDERSRGGKSAPPRGANRPKPEPGPTWIRTAEVEDVTPNAPPPEPPPAPPREAEPAITPALKRRRGRSAYLQAQARWDDLFRIRTLSKPLARHRSDAISDAARRKPPAARSPL